MKCAFVKHFYWTLVGTAFMQACDTLPEETDEAVCESLPFSEWTGIGSSFEGTRELLQDHYVWEHLFRCELGSCAFYGDQSDFYPQCEWYFDEPDWGMEPDLDVYTCSDWRGSVVPCDVQRCTVEMQLLFAMSLATNAHKGSYKKLCEDVSSDGERLAACMSVTHEYYFSCFEPKGRVHQQRPIGVAATP
jgi:hypothetical protein